MKNDFSRKVIHFLWQLRGSLNSVFRRQTQVDSTGDGSPIVTVPAVVYTEHQSIKGKRVIVSGATGFIGSHIAFALRAAGAEVTLLGRSEKKLQQLVETKFDSSQSTDLPTVNTLCSSINNLDEAKQVADEYAQRYGSLDILINCIGSAEDKPFIFHTVADLDDSMASNLNPIVNLCEAFLPGFVRQSSGCIINLSSVTGSVGQPMRSLYGANKGAVIAYSKSIARGYAEHNIRVNCVAPQVVAGGLADKMNPDVSALLKAITPIKRDCEAQDLIGPILMLANEQQGFMTGEVVNITGGMITW